MLLSSDGFVLAGHINPDGDAIGSCLALGMALKNMGKTVHVLLESFSNKFSVIPGCDLIYSGSIEELDFNVFIALDCGATDRLGESAKLLSRAKIVACIDHHASHESFAPYTCLDPLASSTCELVYQLISPLGLLDDAIASAIYAGICTDTGGFRYESCGSYAMGIVSELLKLKVPSTDIYNGLMMSRSLIEAKVLSRAVEKLQMHEGGKIAATFMCADDLNELGAGSQEAGGVAAYLLNIEGVEASLFIYEKARGCLKASFRAHTLEVMGVAERFGGGGHKLAAGCVVYGDITKVFIEMLDSLKAAYIQMQAPLAN
ncbi:MAG: bifunctional oligoribonuclease/PAP phosphatase NrnA [Clostridiales bacterium]|nr:bifunctional oligoribonuclease/PAP phosphatase NrnA [Clostridiales bacterium]